MLIHWQDFLALTSAHAALPLRRSAPRVAESDQRGLRCSCTARFEGVQIWLTQLQEAPGKASLLVECRWCRATWIWGQR